jgi:lysophospholipid acyltransferase (LPLAT)-like uncharacterized protein
MKLRLDHPLLRHRAPALARSLVQAYLHTCSTELMIDPVAREIIFAGRPVLYTAWHCHLLFPLFYAQNYSAQLPPVVLMASPSHDGEFIAAVARGLGFTVCLGSRRKGGVQALKLMSDYHRQGYSCGLIADGSRGPARVAQNGPLYLARITGAPIVPLAVAASRRKIFQTWDRFVLPLPFSRLALLVGEPLLVGPAARGPALEALRQELEDRLNKLFQQAQDFFAA